MGTSVSGSFFEIDEGFSWRGLWWEIRNGDWEFGWDDRKPLPGCTTRCACGGST
jgi:hypothetical protein